MLPEDFNKIKESVPKLPGVYRFYDKNNTVIYVGKALSLYHRVGSYFRSSGSLTSKTRELMQNASHLDWIACPDENDALLLENNLIKQSQPKYNINLKDNKTYPYIVIRDEPFPRIDITRTRTKVGKSEYYGPYTSIMIMRDVLRHIRTYIPLRTCSLNLSPKAIAKKKYKPCLEYHIEKCKAPCIGLQSEEEYMKEVDEIRMLLKGNFKSLVRHYKEVMKQKAEALLFEEAQKYKERIDALLQLKHSSFFEFPSEEDLDICCFKEDGKDVWVHFAIVKQGCIIQSLTTCYAAAHTDLGDEALLSIVVDLRTKFSSSSTHIISNMSIPAPENMLIKVPIRGIKKEMIDWAMNNIERHIENKKKLDKKEEGKMDVLRDMQKNLHLPSLPLRIESFDNSHLQGSAQVSAMVCFIHGSPSKKDYRTFHIKSTDHADDYASMREVIYRRYLRRINEAKPLPDLIIIDGGKGQLNEAKQSLDKLQLGDKIALLSIAKKNEWLFFPGDKEPVILDKRDPVLRLIQQIRDETHRFVISFHRKSQSKKSLRSADKKGS